jgi:hypothetical protein
MMAGATRSQSSDRQELYVVVVSRRFGGGSSWSFDSAPTCAGGGKRPTAALTQQSFRQMRLIENVLIKQIFARKARSRLSVICATPFQKRP